SPTGKGVFADLLLPAVQAFYDAFSRSLAMVRALRISNALTAFRQEQGREAKDLSELPLPKETVVDPFSGAPLKIKLTEEGWIIYSVFKNGVDDGGDFRQEEDYGLAPPGYSKQRSRE